MKDGDGAEQVCPRLVCYITEFPATVMHRYPEVMSVPIFGRNKGFESALLEEYRKLHCSSLLFCHENRLLSSLGLQLTIEWQLSRKDLSKLIHLYGLLSVEQGSPRCRR